MATMLCLFILSISISSLLTPSFSGDVAGTIHWWCNKTPYPDACNHYLNLNNASLSFSSEKKSDFLKIAVQITMNQTLWAKNQSTLLRSNCHDEKEKAAWADCLELFQNTILQLNQTLDPCSDFDAQTWVSTSLTNLETCRTGFTDLGRSHSVLDLLSTNVSKLISNTLAIISDTVDEQNYTNGFPSWVSAGDRKLLQTSAAAGAFRADIVVAKDGSGNFRTINSAVSAAARRRNGSDKRFVIYVKAGVYTENVEIDYTMKNIMLVGDGLRKTIITSRRSVRRGYTTFNSATFGAMGERFIARGITFRNTAGRQNGQAVALRSGSDHSVFYRCGIEGYQDTLYVHSQRQFYKECYIYGTIDFIFGNAAVVLQNCLIYARKPMAGQANVITAQGRTELNQNTGISIHSSLVAAAPDLRPFQSSVKTFLGRPWKLYSRVVYLQTYLDKLIDPAGWSPFDGNYALNSLYYGEYGNYGPASATSRRVKWRGYHAIRNPTEASKFTVGNFIAGKSWLPATGVPFTSGL